MTTNLRRRLRTGSDQGFTLVESLVAIGLFTVLGSVVFAVFLGLTTLNGGTASLNTGVSDLRVSLNSAAAKLHNASRYYAYGPLGSVVGSNSGYASPFFSGCGTAQKVVTPKSTGNEIWFTANLGDPGGLSVVRMYVNSDNQLIEEVTPPNGQSYYTGDGDVWDGVDRTCRVLADDILVPKKGERPIFTYYPAGKSTPLNPSDPTSSIGSTKATLTYAVEVSLTTKNPSKRAKAATARVFVPFAQALADQNSASQSWNIPPTTTLPPPDGMPPPPPPSPAPGSTTSPAPGPAPAPSPTETYVQPPPPSTPPGGLA